MPPVLVEDVGADAVLMDGRLILRPEQSWDNAVRAVASLLPDAAPDAIRELVHGALPDSGPLCMSRLVDRRRPVPVVRPRVQRRRDLALVYWRSLAVVALMILTAGALVGAVAWEHARHEHTLVEHVVEQVEPARRGVPGRPAPITVDYSTP